MFIRLSATYVHFIVTLSGSAHSRAGSGRDFNKEFCNGHDIFDVWCTEEETKIHK